MSGKILVLNCILCFVFSKFLQFDNVLLLTFIIKNDLEKAIFMSEILVKAVR